MAVHKVIRTTPLAQPQPKSERLTANTKPEPLPVRAHAYRSLAIMNNGLEEAIHGLEELKKITYFSSSESLHGIHSLLCRIREQANGEAMAVLAERETANARHSQQLCLESEGASR
ncbi:MAG: hypothetical protein LAO78_24215 [Acidobacteriia bacterium]|nr:hypothetical protein [Terriglobia bacterium]